jgi:hypothetical protein
MGTRQPKQRKHSKRQTSTFLLELPLVVEPGQVCRLRAHLEAGRQLYNAIFSEGNSLMLTRKEHLGSMFRRAKMARTAIGGKILAPFGYDCQNREEAKRLNHPFPVRMGGVARTGCISSAIVLGVYG